ncbi:UDP-2,3-diacylglucosamine pyrophosphatase LpxH/glycosyltransferase involved in cell wall biosynthesis [Bradyrhizobium diazoefficiens]
MGSYDVSDESPERRFRTLFISDVHLGARGSQADLLLDFLRYHDAETIYLVGDIVDGWALKSSWHWPQSHNDLVQKLLRKARKGAKVIYIPGNHDEFLRNYYGTHFGGIDVVENTVHTGVDGKRYLVIHGDIFDLVVQNARWLAHLGDKAYDFAIQMNRFVNFFRRMFKVPYWSLSQWAQAEGQERRQLYRRVRAGARRRSAPSRRRRRDLRPHPLCRDPRRGRHRLHELRRLGGELHRAGRARRRPFRDHHLGGSVAEARAGAASGSKGRLMRILVATDAWHPQVNGVVRTLTKLADAAKGLSVEGVGVEGLGVEFNFLTPQSFRTFAMPSYRDVRLAMPRPARIAKLIAEARPESIHIATEGPIGLMVRRYCRQRKLPFTTSFHTRFPEYVRARVPVPGSLIWRALRRFHAPSRAVMAATPALARELTERGFDNVVLWPRGVDTHLFHPRAIDLCLPAPVFLSVGRVAVEKNLEAFLDLKLPGTKVVVGDGPARASLEEAYPDAIFLGEKHGEALAEIYAAADVFVFPSKTDTFGLVLLEALASGLPVAAFPVKGPRDVIGDAPVGALDHDLRSACFTALSISRQDCVEFAANYTWEASARAFIDSIRAVGAVLPGRNGAEQRRFVA